MAEAGKNPPAGTFEDWTPNELAIRMRMLYDESRRIASGVNGTVNLFHLRGAEALGEEYAEEYRVFEN